MIAHRLSTIQNADRIFVIDKGGILEQGSPAELMEKRALIINFIWRSLQVCRSKNICCSHSTCERQQKRNRKFLQEDAMFLTTLCYIEKDDCYLMLHRVKKENDLNHDKWIGVGGKFEAEEMPEECMMREVKEETGLTLTSYRARGVITFISNEWGTEYMHLFTADQFTGR